MSELKKIYRLHIIEKRSYREMEEMLSIPSSTLHDYMPYRFLNEYHSKKIYYFHVAYRYGVTTEKDYAELPMDLILRGIGQYDRNTWIGNYLTSDEREEILQKVREELNTNTIDENTKEDL